MATTTSKTLSQALWNSADILRSKMDANEYKTYLLSLVFYKYLSDKMLLKASELLEADTDDLAQAQRNFEEAFADERLRDELINAVKEDVSYVIEPKLTFTHLVDMVNKGKFQLEDLAQGFREIEQSSEIFENLFEDVDLYSKKIRAKQQ